MKLAEQALREAVAERITALGSNPFAVEQEYGLPEDAVRSILKGTKKSGTALNKAQVVCAALGLELYVGPPRDSGLIESVTLDGAEYAHIPLHDAMLAAGDGHQNHAESVIDHLAFRRDWLERVGVSASGARLARVQGDSMQPTIWSGDMVMIDTARHEPLIRTRDARDQRRVPVYALIDNGEARVKRIERPSTDAMLLISDNPDYPPELRQGSDIQAIQIIGKVVWWGHTAKE